MKRYVQGTITLTLASLCSPVLAHAESTPHLHAADVLVVALLLSALAISVVSLRRILRKS